MKLIYIGKHFYPESNGEMSPLYTETGERFSLGEISTHLDSGGSVEIRQATGPELDYYEARLSRLRRLNAGMTV